MAKTVIGVKETNKDGKRSFTVYFSEPFADWEAGAENNIKGLKCDSEWTNQVDCGFLKVGDTIEFSYAKGFQGKAILSGIQVIKNSDK